MRSTIAAGSMPEATRVRPSRTWASSHATSAAINTASDRAAAAMNSFTARSRRNSANRASTRTPATTAFESASARAAFSLPITGSFCWTP